MCAQEVWLEHRLETFIFWINDRFLEVSVQFLEWLRLPNYRNAGLKIDHFVLSLCRWSAEYRLTRVLQGCKVNMLKPVKKTRAFMYSLSFRKWPVVCVWAVFLAVMASALLSLAVDVLCNTFFDVQSCTFNHKVGKALVFDVWYFY